MTMDLSYRLFGFDCNSNIIIIIILFVQMHTHTKADTDYKLILREREEGYWESTVACIYDGTHNVSMDRSWLDISK